MPDAAAAARAWSGIFAMPFCAAITAGTRSRCQRACPSCGNQDLKGLGQGTQRLEQLLGERFSGARILRIDRDSTRRKHAWHTMQDDIRRERVDILVGTQMLARRA